MVKELKIIDPYELTNQAYLMGILPVEVAYKGNFSVFQNYIYTGITIDAYAVTGH